jgi:mono/diheme cytochrome c family protein
MRKTLGNGVVALFAAGMMISAGASAPTAAIAQAPDLAAQQAALSAEGQQLFLDNCSPCHGENGQGLNGPRLDGNTFIASREAIVNQILFGALDHGMPPFIDQLNDHEIAAIATYVRNAWSNRYGVVLEQSVALRRAMANDK